MRYLIPLLVACKTTQVPPPAEPPPEPVTVALEWKADQAPDGRVDVSLVIGGKAVSIGPLDATTESEAGTPATCALRPVHVLRSEFQCGTGNYFAAELQPGELVISMNDGEHTVEVKRIPLQADALAVKAYAL